MDTMIIISPFEFEDKFSRIKYSLDNMQKNKKTRFVKKILYRTFYSAENFNISKRKLQKANTQCIIYLPNHYNIQAKKQNVISNCYFKLEFLVNNPLICKKEIQILWSLLPDCTNIKFCLLIGGHKTKTSYYPVLEMKWVNQLLFYYYAGQCRIKCRSKNMFKTFYNLLHIVMKRDVDVSSHCIRVGFYSGFLAEKFGIEKRKILDIEIAGALHDLGKLGVPKHILNKPTTLSEDEYAFIKKHPLFTNNILEKIEGFNHIANITLLHHERYDGSGYPLGLKGNSIPIESQILSIADTFDAMTTDRPYRKALNLEKALQLLSDESGRQFNPEIVELAINSFPEIYNTSYTFT